LWTTHPEFIGDRHWNSDPSTRAGVLGRMSHAHVNTVVASYWSNMPQWSPMQLDATSWPALIETVQGSSLVILPAIESGFDPAHPEIPHWQFCDESPFDPATGQVAPGLVERIGSLCDMFAGRMDSWAALYGLTLCPVMRSTSSTPRRT
jgi:hypothetical protein